MKLFKQEKHYTCGIAVCRAIIDEINNKFFSEEEMLDIINEFKFDDEGWKEDFLGGKIGMPTEYLPELLSKCFDIESEIKYNVSTENINQKVLVVLEETKNNYHAVFIKSIDKTTGKIIYINPSDGKEHDDLTIADFNEKRKPKDKKDHNFLEILIPNNGAKF